MDNILITSAGRRVELVSAFQEQMHKLLLGGFVHAIDNQPELSAACQLAQVHAKCPRALDSEYPEFLFNYCIENNIRLVVPTIDTELKVLAQHKTRFAQQGIVLCISSSELINYCRDKRKTGEFFNRYEVRYPEIYDGENLTFPCFAKPKSGSCSIGAQAILTKNTLTPEIFDDPEMMFMELVDKSYVEYTIDAYYNKNGKLKCLVPRKRIETRAGEVSKGITVRNIVYDDLAIKMSEVEGAVGCLTIQVFMNESDGDYIGLEINPRFGGGYPLAYAAGANYPGWLIKEYFLNEDIPFFDAWENNLLMLRYDSQVLVRDAEA